MADFVLTGFSSVPRILEATDNGFIGQDGELVTSDATGISAQGFNQVTVNGSLSSLGGSGIIGIGTTLNVMVGSAGNITGSLDAIATLQTVKTTIFNNGTISSANDALDLGTFDDAAQAEVVNNGNITAAFDAIELDLKNGIATIFNHGRMTALQFGINVKSAARVDFTNTGILAATFAAYLGDAGIDNIVNRGTIDGSVNLGAGNDTLDARGGAIAGTVFGGRGDDTFIIDDPTIDIDERDDEGNDAVHSSVGFALPSRIEQLFLTGTDNINGFGNGADNALVGNVGDNHLIGRGGNDSISGQAGDDTLFGGSGENVLVGGEGDDRLVDGRGNSTLIGGEGDDTLIGQGGRDRLTGDDGEDVFLFRKVSDSKPGKADVIADFAPGEDVIDLRRIDADVTTPGNQAFTLVEKMSAVPGELLAMVLNAYTVILGDVDGDAEPDFRIQVFGNFDLTDADILL